MAKKEQVAVYTPAMSDAAVKLKTGKTWTQWFAALDKAGASAQTHRAIARMLSETFDVGPWWCQMVAVEYERGRGLRARHETATGYSVSVSKTIGCALPTLYNAAADARARKKWFPDGAFKPTSQTKNKYLRGSWNGSARLEIGFTEKGADKSQIAVQVGRLARKSDVDPTRAVWKAALARLAEGLG